MTTYPSACLDCGRDSVPIVARGLDAQCYGIRRYAGTLHERPTLPRPEPAAASQRSSRVKPPRPPARALEVPATSRQIHYWVTAGWLCPDNPGVGAGRALEWSDAERVVANRMARLVAAGVRPDVAANVARQGGGVEIAPGITVTVDDPKPTTAPPNRRPGTPDHPHTFTPTIPNPNRPMTLETPWTCATSP